MFKRLIVIASLILSSVMSIAHEDHNQAPGAITANHGGTVKAGKEINLEYVVTGNEVKIYPVSHEGKDLTAADVSLTATTKLPKGKTEAAKLELKDGAFVTTTDFKSAFRIEVVVTAVTKGKKDIFKFQIEK